MEQREKDGELLKDSCGLWVMGYETGCHIGAREKEKNVAGRRVMVGG